jgi:neutral trehalase
MVLITDDIKVCKHTNSITVDKIIFKDNNIILYFCTSCKKILKIYINNKELVDREEFMKIAEKVIADIMKITDRIATDTIEAVVKSMKR